MKLFVRKLTCSSDKEKITGDVSMYKFKLKDEILLFFVVKSHVPSAIVETVLFLALTSRVALKHIFFTKFRWLLLFKVTHSKFNISRVQGKQLLSVNQASEITQTQMCEEKRKSRKEDFFYYHDSTNFLATLLAIYSNKSLNLGTCLKNLY